MPDLTFRVVDAEPREFAAVPTLLFKLKIENRHPEPVRSVTLHTQIRIVPNGRPYSVTDQPRLLELFGEPYRWGDTLKSFVWTHTTVLVPPFTGNTVVDMPVTCTYDFDVVSTKYFHAIGEGDIPLEFLFSGTIFYEGPAETLQVVQIPWEKEADFLMPVSVWKDTMEHFFPNSAWLRLSKETFDRFYSYRVQRGSSSWDAALEDLLRSSADKVKP